MWDWLWPEKTYIPPVEPPVWKTIMQTDNTFTLDKVKVFADTNGNIKIDFNGYIISIPAVSRREFLDKINKAFAMANGVDPGNK